MYPDKLKNLRERIGLTKTDIANIIGIDRSQYGHYENDYITIPIKHLVSLINYYHVSLDYIFDFTNQKNYKPITSLEIDKQLSGKRLKEIRKELKITQTDLANFLNTSFTTISSYERGINAIATNYLYVICQKYHISADYLLGRTAKPKYLQEN